jgi:hypothetical protein
MKKSIFYLSVLAVAATTLFACNKLEVKQEAVSEPQTVTFNAGVSPITKTTFGALDVNKYPTIWTDNDANVKIAQNYSAGQDAAVTKVSDSQATFAATFSDYASGSYTFYAVSPASAVVSGVSSSYKNWNLEIPTDQTSTATGPDEDAMIMVASSSTVTTFPTSVDLSFTHLTAYAKMSIINLALDGGDQISSVLITGSNNIAYRYYYYVGGENQGTLQENSAQNSITVHTTSASNIWFACAPMAIGTQLTIAVTTTNSKVYTKSGINIPSALAAGEVAVFDVNFNGISADETKVYSLVKNYSELTDGSKVIISALGDTDYAMGVMTSTDNFASHVATAKSADDQTITNPAATVDVFTLGVGTVDNTIAFNGTNGYLYASSSGSNYMSVQTTNNANGSWTPTIKNNSTGEVLLKANGTNRPYMRYNGDHDRFSCYSTEGENVAIYKLNGSGSSTQLFVNKLNQVSITSASGDDTGFTATWEKPSNAPETGVTYTYTLYQGTDATGTLVVSNTVTDALTLTNTTALTLGNDYYLTIVASVVGSVASDPSGLGFTAATSGPSTTTSIDFSAQGYSNAQSFHEVTVSIDTNIGVYFDKGTNNNTPKYYTSGTAIRVYGGSYFTVSSPTGKTITKITLTYGSSDGSNTITTDVVTFSSPTWTGSASSVKFTIGGTSGNRRIKGIEVTYNN